MNAITRSAVKFRRNWIPQHLFILRFKFGNVIHKFNIVNLFIVQKSDGYVVIWFLSTEIGLIGRIPVNRIILSPFVLFHNLFWPAKHQISPKWSFFAKLNFVWKNFFKWAPFKSFNSGFSLKCTNLAHLTASIQ